MSAARPFRRRSHRSRQAEGSLVSAAGPRLVRHHDCLMLHRLAAACCLALATPLALAEKTPLDDEQLRSISAKGIAIAVDLELNTGAIAGTSAPSNISAGFVVAGITTYAIVQNFGGGLQMFSIAIDPSVKPDGSGYLAIGMPTYLNAQDFGIHAIGVQTDPHAPLTGSLGALTLNGVAAMTGQLNLWPMAARP
jgi:uncharacterized protein DUF6160